MAEKAVETVVENATGKTVNKVIESAVEDVKKEARKPSSEREEEAEKQTVKDARAIGNTGGRAIVFGLFGAVEGLVTGLFDITKRMLKKSDKKE